MLKRLALAAALALALAACGSSSDEPAPETNARAEQLADATPESQGSPLDPDLALAAIRRAGHEITNERRTASTCYDLGCSSRLTTDQLSLLTFFEEADADVYVNGFGDDAKQIGPVVLSYGAARTPAADRRRYERAVRREMKRLERILNES